LKDVKENKQTEHIEERVKEMTMHVETERQRSDDLQKRLDKLQAFVRKRGSVRRRASEPFEHPQGQPHAIFELHALR